MHLKQSVKKKKKKIEKTKHVPVSVVGRRHLTSRRVSWSSRSLLPPWIEWEIERRLVPSLEIDSPRERRHRGRTATDEDHEHATRVHDEAETRAEIAEVR